MEKISPKEAERLIREQGARLVDVRERHEFDEVRIPGSQLMPLSEFEGDPTMLPPAKVTIFQCAHGVRSETAADLYESAWPGVSSFSLEGGIVAWADEDLPTER